MTSVDISAFIAAVRAAVDIAKGLNAIRDEYKRETETLELSTRLNAILELSLSLKAEKAELLKVKEEILKREAEINNWAITEAEYELQEIHRGIFVYAKKKPGQSSEPLHWLCANCYQQKKKSILQAKYDNEAAALYSCPRCAIEIHWRKKPDEFHDLGTGGLFGHGAY